MKPHPILIIVPILFLFCVGIYAVKSDKPVADAGPVREKPASILDAALNERIFQLRVAEYRGAFFERMALDMMKGHVDYDRMIAASKKAADAIAAEHPEEKFSGDALRQAAKEFESRVNAARH